MIEKGRKKEERRRVEKRYNISRGEGDKRKR
jgi:hypothetical protein